MAGCFHVSTLLMHIADLEARSADLYAFYADVFEDTEIAATVFRQMKQEELAHKNQALFQKRIVDRNPHAYPKINVDITPITQLINAVESHISDGVFTVLDALGFAIALEENAVEFHYHTMAEQICPELSTLTQFLKNGDALHIRKLMDLKSCLEFD